MRAAEELDRLPEGSAAVEMLADYVVMREQGRVCAGGWADVLNKPPGKARHPH